MDHGDFGYLAPWCRFRGGLLRLLYLRLHEPVRWCPESRPHRLPAGLDRLLGLLRRVPVWAHADGLGRER